MISRLWEGKNLTKSVRLDDKKKSLKSPQKVWNRNWNAKQKKQNNFFNEVIRNIDQTRYIDILI